MWIRGIKSYSDYLNFILVDSWNAKSRKWFLWFKYFSNPDYMNMIQY